MTIQSAPVVQWDGGADDAAHACAILNAVPSCPDGQDVNLCAATLRNDRAQPHPMYDVACIIAAGPNILSLQACGVCK